MAKAAALLAIQDRLNDLMAALEQYRGEVKAEKAAAPENEGLQRLLGLQLKRIDWVVEALESQAEETIRDMVDRNHVIEEARAGRFN